MPRDVRVTYITLHNNDFISLHRVTCSEPDEYIMGIDDGLWGYKMTYLRKNELIMVRDLINRMLGEKR